MADQALAPRRRTVQGYDTVDVLDKCGTGFEIFAVENVRTDALVGESWDPGPCN